MCDTNRSNPVHSPSQGRWWPHIIRLAIALGIAAISVALGCSSQKNYHVLSFFFDGVPDPNAKVTVRQVSEGGEANAVYRSPIKSTHKPFADGKCDACHKGGTEGNYESVSTLVDSNVCMKCHSAVVHEHAIMHAPVTAKACLFCHNPHESTEPALLAQAAPAVCTQCHEPSLLGKNPPEHLSENSACLDCHTGHGGLKRPFLRENFHVSPVRPATQPATQPSQQQLPPIASQGAKQLSAAGAPAGGAAECGVGSEESGVAGDELKVASQTATSTPDTPLPTPHKLALPAPDAQTPPVGAPAALESPPASIMGPYRPILLATELPEQAQGPTVVGGPRQMEFFHLGQIKPAIEFRYRRESDSFEPKNGVKTKFTEDQLEEDLELASTAYIFHPNFVELTLNGTFGLRQDWIDESGNNHYGRETVYDYDAEATILQKGEAPLTVYSRRNTNIINRQFGASFDNTITTSGAALDWRNKVIPTRIEFYHTDQDQKALDNSQNFIIAQNTATIFSNAALPHNQRLTFNYTFNSVDQTASAPVIAPVGGTPGTGSSRSSFDTHDITLSHTYDFGLRQQNNLSSSVNFFDQTGDFPLERLHWDERLRLRHTDTFETRYQYTLDYQSSDIAQFGSISETQHTFITGFTHYLYKSLVTSGNAGVRELDQSDNSGAFGYFGNINFDYHKQVPLGRLSLSTGYSFDQQENRAQGNITHIVNQSRTFNDPLPITIVGANIIANSLVIRDSTGVIVYLENLDYLLRDFPDHVEIERVVGGRIVNGQAVLISYDLSPQPGNTVTNNTFSASARYDIQKGLFKGVGLYARYFLLDQHIESDFPGLFIPNSLHDTTAGADFRFLDFTVGGEYEWHHSRIAPYDASRFFGRFEHRIALDTTMALAANYSIYQYPDEHNRVRLFTTTGTVTHYFTRELSTSASLTYLDQSDKLFGGTDGLEESVQVQWTHRQTRVYAQFRQSNLHTSAQDTSFQTVYVGIRREF